jgi:hypothetical protein
MDLNDLSDLARARFAYLFDEYGFVYVRSRETSDGQYRGCEVVISGPLVIGFLYQEPSVASVVLGSLEDGGADLAECVDARRLLDFISDRPLRWKPPYQAGAGYVDSVFSGLADEMRPLMPRILEMFKNRHEESKWRAAFDEYVRKEVKRQYDLPKGRAP